MLVRLLQSLNALSPILVTLFGMVTLVRLLQPMNTLSFITVTLSGMVTLVRLRRASNADCPILVTGLPLHSAGIIISVSLSIPIPAIAE